MQNINLAIFGGSFNPPHSGHMAIVKAAMECEKINFLIILPNFQNPLKHDSAPFLSNKERFELLITMTRKAVDSSKIKIYQKMPSISQINAIKNHKIILISSLEIMQKKPSFAIESILYFKNLYSPKNLYFIVGADILGELEQWHRIDEIRQNVSFIVATRGGIPIPKEFLQLNVRENISSTAIRNARNHIESGTNLANINLKNGAKNLDILDNIDDKNTQNRLESIINLLDSKKAENIAMFDLRKTPYITSFVVIATSLADKHSFALLDMLKTELKASGEIFYSTDEESGDWIIADLGDVMIHIFTENHRKKFNLDEFLENFKREKP